MRSTHATRAAASPAVVTAMDGGIGGNAGAVSIRNKRYTHRHHIKHWANDGETKLGNLITLCYFHHRLVHEGGWDVQVLDDGAFRFLKPDGEAFGDYAPMSGNRTELLSFLPITTQHSLVTPAQWCGDKMDYGLAVQLLCHKEARAKSVLLPDFRAAP